MKTLTVDVCVMVTYDLQKPSYRKDELTENEMEAIERALHEHTPWLVESDEYDIELEPFIQECNRPIRDALKPQGWELDHFHFEQSKHARWYDVYECNNVFSLTSSRQTDEKIAMRAGINALKKCDNQTCEGYCGDAIVLMDMNEQPFKCEVQYEVYAKCSVTALDWNVE